MEVELRLWCCTEELHTTLTLIHTLENTLADMNNRNAELHMTIEKVWGQFFLKKSHLYPNHTIASL